MKRKYEKPMAFEEVFAAEHVIKLHVQSTQIRNRRMVVISGEILYIAVDKRIT